MLSSACKNTAPAYYRFLDVGLCPPLEMTYTRVVFYYNELGGKIFCSGFFFCREKKILASMHFITLCHPRSFLL